MLISLFLLLFGAPAFLRQLFPSSNLAHAVFKMLVPDYFFFIYLSARKSLNLSGRWETAKSCVGNSAKADGFSLSMNIHRWAGTKQRNTSLECNIWEGY